MAGFKRLKKISSNKPKLYFGFNFFNIQLMKRSEVDKMGVREERIGRQRNIYIINFQRENVNKKRGYLVTMLLNVCTYE